MAKKRVGRKKKEPLSEAPPLPPKGYYCLRCLKPFRSPHYPNVRICPICSGTSVSTGRLAEEVRNAPKPHIRRNDYNG